MTLDADIRLSSGEKVVRGRRDQVVAMTNLALCDPQVIEGLLVGALGEQLSGAGMALPADEGDRGHLRRRGAVVAMAIVADGRRKVFFLEKCPGVNALLIVIDLPDGNPVAFHEISVGMAAAAGLRDVPGKGLGFGEAG